MTMKGLDFEIPVHLKEEVFFQTVGVLPSNGILFGFNTIKKVGEQAAKIGGKAAVLVTDLKMVELGFVDLAKGYLEKAGLRVEVFDKVEPEPYLETANALLDFVREKKVDLLIGLGGGSPLDLTKLISIVATNQMTPEEYLQKKKEVSKASLKKILIPTTSGTGSEVSGAVVVSIGKQKYALHSPFAYADIVIIDPGLTLSMPPKITANTGIDALSHAVDTVMNIKQANPLLDSLAIGGIELISQYLRRATFVGQDVEARYYMSLAASMSMMGMINKGAALYSHAIAYVLTLFQHMPHGVACGLCLPYTMAFNLPVIEDKLALIARAMGERIECRSARDAGWRAVEMVYELIKEVKMPVGLKEAGFKYEDLPKMAEVLITKFQRDNNPRPLLKEDALDIFKTMWEGTITRN